MYNQNNKYPSILDIDHGFIKMLGIRNYINPTNKKIEEINIQSIVNDLTPHGLIILAYHILNNPYKDRYNLSTELQNRLNDIDIITSSANVADTKSLTINLSIDHSLEENNKLENVYFNMYESKLKLDESGYAEVPDKIRFKEFFNRWVYDRTNLSIFNNLRIKNIKESIQEKILRLSNLSKIYNTTSNKDLTFYTKLKEEIIRDLLIM